MTTIEYAISKGWVTRNKQCSLPVEYIKRIKNREHHRRTYKPRIHKPRKGEVRLKEFIANEAERLHAKESAIYERYYRGKYDVKVRRVNGGVVFVKVNQ